MKTFAAILLLSLASTATASPDLTLSLVDGHLHNDGPCASIELPPEPLWWWEQAYGSFAAVEVCGAVTTLRVVINLRGPDWAVLDLVDDGQTILVLARITRDRAGCQVSGDVDCRVYENWDAMRRDQGDFVQCVWAILRRAGVDVQGAK